MHLDAAVVIDKAEPAKAVHKEADAGSCGANHLRQGFLRNGRNEGFRFTQLAKIRHQQENSRQTLFAGVEELVDKIGLGAHAAGQQKRQKQVGKGMLFMNHASHLLSSRSEERRVGKEGRSRWWAFHS